MLRAYYVSKRMYDTLRAGVTTIRDMSSADNIGVILKKAAAEGFIECPRIITSLKGICMTGGHGWGMRGAIIEADGDWEIRKAVRKNIRDGADCIKILTSEAYRGEELSQSELNAAVDEAHRLGKKIAAHAGYSPSIEMCIQAGCDTIEHGTNLTVEQALRMKANDQTWVPTIYVFNYVNDLVQCNSQNGYNEHKAYLEDSVAAYEANFMKLYATGVRVATGTDTDAANHPEASPVKEELNHMVRLGLTPLQAIACATKNSGEALGLKGSLGLLKEGYTADIIAVRGDVATDITLLQNIEAVYQGGKRCMLQ